MHAPTQTASPPPRLWILRKVRVCVRVRVRGNARDL